jgi:hypothetical protein
MVIDADCRVRDGLSLAPLAVGEADAEWTESYEDPWARRQEVGDPLFGSGAML